MPYPKDDDAVDHSAPGHHIPDKVNEIYNAVKREHPEYDKSKAMAIAWSRSGLKHEGSWQVVALGPDFDPGVYEHELNDIDPSEHLPGERCPMCGQGMVEMGRDLGRGVYTCPGCGYIGGARGQDEGGSGLPAGPDLSDYNTHGPLYSSWQTVSLGELQQPGGVGATQEYNPVVDGPNPDQPPDVDNAQNSPEQEVALETWVNMAVDLLNRGEDQEAILARLAHDGCPDPQSVLRRAMEQPDQESPVSDELGQDPFNAPPAADATSSGEMQGLSQQPPVLGRVRIAGTTMTGTVEERWEDLWGQGIVRVALDDGGTLNVAPTAIEEENKEMNHPVSEIQQFIDGLPVVEPTRPSVEAKIANLELARQAIRSTISKVAFSDAVKLESMEAAAEEEIRALKDYLTSNIEADTVVKPYRVNALGLGQAGDVPTYQGNPREAGAIWASECPWIRTASYSGDEQDIHASAVKFAEELNMTGEQFNEFIDSAHKYLTEHRTIPTEPNADLTENEGPAEALFL